MSRFASILLLLLCPLAARAANLASGEWFIDSDPGHGAGTAFALPAASGATTSVTIPAVVLNGLEPGFHLLGVRLLDAEGEWGHVVWRAFHKDPELEVPRLLAGAEWFIDEDPGAGLGTAFALPAAGTATVTPQVPAAVLNSLSEGFHLLGVRTRDNLSHWGPVVWRAFHIDRSPVPGPDIVAVQYRILRDGQEVFQATAEAEPTGATVSLTVAHGTEALLLDSAHTVQVIPLDALGQRGHAAYADFTVQNAASLPSVTAASAGSITSSSASTGGSVTADGGASVTERGVVYATTPDPTTLTGTKVVSASGLGDFTCDLTSLSAGTTYFVRAYAINSEGTAYGEQIQFTTLTVAVLAVNPASQTVAAAGGSHDFSVTATGAWSWSLSAGSDWVTSGEAGSQSGNQTFSYTVPAHTGTAARSATLTLTSGALTATHTITQDGGGTPGGRRMLTLDRVVPDDLAATPDKAGVLALKATPAKDAGKLSKGPGPQSSEVLPGTQVTVTATARSGHWFEEWSGLPAGAQVLGNTVIFTMPDADVPGLTAGFIANPFGDLGSKPVFLGLLNATGAAPAGNGSVGHLSATVTAAKGSFSVKVLMDGQSTSCSGILLGDGSVWFRVGKTLTGNLPLKDGIVAGKTLSASWSEDGWQVAVSAAASEISAGLAQPALYRNDPDFHAPLDLLNRARDTQGYFTLAFPAQDQTPEKDASTYPQGTGYATLTLAQAGTLKLAGVLADGTRITASSFLVEGDASPLFIPLRTPGGKISDKGGSLSGELLFDPSANDSDAGGEAWWWFRPAAKTKATSVQAYRSGWPEGVTLDPVGALYDAALPAQEALGLEDADPVNGNALLAFASGKLDTEVAFTNFNLSGSKVVKIPANDKSFSLTLTSKTGLIKGAFTPEWAAPLAPTKRLPAFQGVLLQKGQNAGGWGFFLSNAQGDLEPESGTVTLSLP